VRHRTARPRTACGRSRRAPGCLNVAVGVLALVSMSAPLLAASPCWVPPVAAPITDPFRAPACAWCPGNRGIEYGTAAGVPVRAVTTGTVTFSGLVAGRRYVVVIDAVGRRVTYGDLGHPTPAPGALVVAGSIIGVTTGPLHLGVRVGDEYVDPAEWIGAVVIRPYLVPVDGRPGRRPVAAVHCGAARGGG
jgi:murein DD-endopeptidase MepM/ murein hydrolase activator NlpD